VATNRVFVADMIVEPFRRELAPAFGRLNREGIERLFAFEPTRSFSRALAEKSAAEAVIAFARSSDAELLMLLTSSRLPEAIRLYRRLGFQDRPLPADCGYARADVYMELALQHLLDARPPGSVIEPF
jgi:hypothetical protein